MMDIIMIISLVVVLIYVLAAIGLLMVSVINYVYLNKEKENKWKL